MRVREQRSGNLLLYQEFLNFLFIKNFFFLFSSRIKELQNFPHVVFSSRITLLWDIFQELKNYRNLSQQKFLNSFMGCFHQELRNYRISSWGVHQEFLLFFFSSRIKELQKSQPAKFLNSLILDKKKRESQE